MEMWPVFEEGMPTAGIQEPLCPGAGQAQFTLAPSLLAVGPPAACSRIPLRIHYDVDVKF